MCQRMSTFIFTNLTGHQGDNKNGALEKTFMWLPVAKKHMVEQVPATEHCGRSCSESAAGAGHIDTGHCSNIALF